MTSYQAPFESASIFFIIIVMNTRQIKLNNEIVKF